MAYALSPIDLIPDFIPVLGYLDDLLIVPLGISFSLRAIPPAVMEEARATAAASLGERAPASRAAAVAIVVVWVALAAACIAFAWRVFAGR